MIRCLAFNVVFGVRISRSVHCKRGKAMQTNDQISLGCLSLSCDKNALEQDVCLNVYFEAGEERETRVLS